jgi:immune inhibitor A
LNIKRYLALVGAAILTLSLTGTVLAAPPENRPTARLPKTDNIPSPMSAKQDALRQAGLEKLLKGEVRAVGGNRVVEVSEGQFVELATLDQDPIWTLLGEFGDQQANAHPGHPAHGGAAGPAHNEIERPNRRVDNTTIWTADFSEQHYEKLLFDKRARPSMANWYLEQSSGRYSVYGDVTSWVQVPFNAAAYGSNYCGSNVCTRDIGRFIEDQADTWYTNNLATMTTAEIDTYLSQFDIWDRYDYDGDGNFDEADGYIDHFQSVHAGEGEETGGGAQGTDAIWSHRSYVNSIPPFTGQGPTINGVLVDFGGARIGDSSYWIGDYTIEPENGGVGVFAHEYGHDLGLPDLYDTSGNTGGAENGTAWWTIMSQGSYGTVNGKDLGSNPTHFGAWEKLQLGWLDYAVVAPGQRKTVRLGPAETNTRYDEAIVAVLPDKQVTVDVGAPFEGANFYYSGAGNDIDNTMTRTVALPAGTVTMSFQARYHIEPCWDYAYLQVSTDGGATFTNVHTSASTADNTNGQNFGEGITGISGTPLVCDDDLTPTPTWVPVTADLSAYAGSTVQIRFRYWTDGAVVGDGFNVDNIAITGQPLDGGETDPGWTYAGFVRTTGQIVSEHFNAYIGEFRQYRGYDRALKLGPYNFVDPADGEFVQHFPYQDGLLITYWDTSFADNNVGDHPGGGLILPIDAHPKVELWSDGKVARPRLQSYDATFGLQRTQRVRLGNVDGLRLHMRPKPAVSTFDDRRRYWVSGHPGDLPQDGIHGQSEWNSVNVPRTGTKIRVLSVTRDGKYMRVRVN